MDPLPIIEDCHDTLVVGFYDRGNLGDDAFAEAADILFPGCSKASMDDVLEIPTRYKRLVVGGGDVVNPYFMDKLARMTRNFRGSVVGLGLGIPYVKESSHMLPLFDRVVFRFRADAVIATGCMPYGTVSDTGDLATLLPRPANPARKGTLACVCPSRPMTLGCPSVSAGLVEASVALSRDHDEVRVFPFNTGSRGTESDLALSLRIVDAIKASGGRARLGDTSTASGCMEDMAGADLALCCRFHSVVFACHAGVRRVIAPYSTRKVRNLLTSCCALEACGVELPLDQSFMPTSFETRKVVDACRDPERGYFPIPLRNADPEVLAEAVRGADMDRLSVAGHGSSAEALWRRTRTPNEAFVYWKELRDPEGNVFDDARLLCFLASSGNVSSPCLWGLEQEVGRLGYIKDPLETAKYIWKHHRKDGNSSNRFMSRWISEGGGPKLSLPDLRQLGGVSSGAHRSGWPFVVEGIIRRMAESDTAKGVTVDTFVDRTFHWGRKPLIACGALPYTEPWVGFVHHTFDTEYSPWNCTKMFEDPVFLQSLDSCKGLFALSEKLRCDLMKALKDASKNVPVHTLCHPTQPASEEAMFDSKRMEKRIVQVGSWLRNPYSIYELRVPNGWKKVHLVGMDGGSTTCPKGLLDRMSSLQEGVFSPEFEERCNNPFLRGMIACIRRHVGSVEVLQRVSNEKYDEILGSSVVFLDLHDASAVNTVLECLARNTPVVLNRSRAMVDLLGVDYPGFYTDLEDVESLLVDENLEAMRSHLENHPADLDVDVFARGFSDLMSAS